jgi:hypothetical protein
VGTLALSYPEYRSPIAIKNRGQNLSRSLA